MKTIASFAAGFATALALAAGAATMTITSTAGDDARLVPAFTALLQPGCPSNCRNANASDIKAWLIGQLYYVVQNYEHQQAENAIPASSNINAN